MSAPTSATTWPPSVELPGPAPVLGFLLVHAALRSEVLDLAAAAARREDVDRRLARFDRVLRAHHHGADRVCCRCWVRADPTSRIDAARSTAVPLASPTLRVR